VRQVAEAGGGTVAVEDAPGGGALFRLALPWRAVEAESEPRDDARVSHGR
jgi:signal transduction histidine kinase